MTSQDQCTREDGVSRESARSAVPTDVISNTQDTTGRSFKLSVTGQDRARLIKRTGLVNDSRPCERDGLMTVNCRVRRMKENGSFEVGQCLM